MKKIVVCAVLILAASVAFADHSRGLSLGVVGGSSYGEGGFGGGDIGLALHLPSVPIFWGIRANLNDAGLGLGVTGDSYVYDQSFITKGSLNLDWFLGLGGYLNIGLYDTGTTGAFGVRVPIGLSWHIGKPIELWLDLAPGLGLSVEPLQFPDWNVVGEVGLRFWF
ncbi:MAG: hypothetical protein NT080_08265 [Spirochaetes bacterium]|nr:hypothetical protein [Spirochaetota bacterium]